MPRHARYVPHGVIPAVLLPFNDDLSIDEKSFRAHLRDVAATKGISAITINAHSTEVASLSFEEQRRLLAIAQDEIGERLPLVNGVWADGSIEAARIARMATEGGASALLIFPPGPFNSFHGDWDLTPGSPTFMTNGAMQQSVTQIFQLDLWVDDFRAAHDRVMSLGAKVLKSAADVESDDNFQVYADPAGHPFCLCWVHRGL